MFKKWKCALTYVSLLFPIGLVTAAEIPESAISPEASIVIRLKQPKETLQNISGLLNQVDESLTAVIAGNLRTFLGRSVSNPDLAGVDRSRDMFVGVFLSQAKQPGLLYVMPASDAQAIKTAAGEKYQFAIHETWVLYSDDKALVDQAVQLLKNGGQSFQDEMSSQSRDLFAGGDLSVFVNSQKIVQIYQPQLEQAGQKIDVALNQLSQTVNTAPGVNMKPILSLYSTLAKAGLQAVQDSKSYTTTVKAGMSGVGLESLFEVKENSVTDQLFQTNPPQEFAQLGKFPADQLAYFAGAGNTDALITWGMQFTAQMFDDTKQNAEARSKFESIVKEIRSLKFGSYYFSFELGKLSEGVLNAYTISEVEPSAAMRKYTREMMGLMQNISLPGMKQQVTLTPDAEKIGSETVDLTVIKQEVDPKFDPLQVQKRMLEVLYGPMGITNRMAYPKGKVLQAMGATASMKKFLDALNASADSDLIAQNQPAFIEARKQGLSQANILAIIDVPTSIAKGYNIFAESRQQQGPFSEALLKKQGISASYLTFSLSMGPHSLTTRTYVPVQNLKSGFKIFSIIIGQK
ncbi:hypothetical protein [uncultured Gimesia sp.]|uniref:hypothetical protein n=1 Tax=uncultured Gimesia sp. TaxID=1678688 RepID=UPI00260398D8|nr:hypothetical protein [uncultured Gimesia sp.]